MYNHNGKNLKDANSTLQDIMIRPKKKIENDLRWLLLLAALCWAIFLHSVTNPSLYSSSIPTLEEYTSKAGTTFHNFPYARTQSDGDTATILPSVTIFYHIYVPNDQDAENDKESQNRALMIIREQLLQVGEALTSIPNMESSDLFYTTIGHRLQNGYVEDICSEFSKVLQCHHLNHLDSGFEESTLTSLYMHCQEHLHDRVIYLHTKGSFHYRQRQNSWRQHMTDAVTSRDCIERAHKEDCDLCGLLFLPRPTLHFTGNMFNAQCSYIQKLLSPSDFEKKIGLVIAKGQELLEDQILLSNMIDVAGPWNIGLGRYSMEHWHGSHPAVQKICDVSTHYEIEYWTGIPRMDRKASSWQFDVFPRHPHTAAWSFGKADELIDTILNDESKRKRELFLLPGQLMRWYELYGEFPPATSWVWSWYPDGQFWKQQVAKYGGAAVEMIGQSFAE